MKIRRAFHKKSFSAVLAVLVVFVALFGLRADGGIQTDVPALKDVFKDDFYIGCLLSYNVIGLPDDPPVEGQSMVSAPEGGRLIAYHMNSMSPGNMMKPVLTVDINASKAAVAAAADPEKKEYAETHPVITFNPNLVAQLNWAKRRGFTFRGHTLVWHNQTPGQLFTVGYVAGAERVSKDVMLKRLENYIAEVIRLLHEGWPGLLSAMDVVNEAVDDRGDLRTAKNDWYATFGDSSYVAKAFEYARKYTKQYGETQMKLYYNDYNTASPVKCDGILKLLTPIAKAGNLDGIGFQEHDGIGYPTAEPWIAAYDRYARICKEISITELDVVASNENPSAAELEAQANWYAALFKLFLERSARSGRGKIVSVSKDGLNDQFTFRPKQASSLWDRDNQCKPAFYAVVDMARNYKELSALIAAAGKLKQKDFSAADWKALGAALKAGKEALKKNYSVSDSAVTGLGDAVTGLKAAMKGK
jgi:endo-1,4-beta-xylanase